MLPSMRYPSNKLTDLLHHQKYLSLSHSTYRKHRDSLHQIMRKSNSQYNSRSKLLNQLKHRKNQSFYHTQLERSKQIGSNNSLIYHKLSSYQPDRTSNSSLEQTQRKIDMRNLELEMLSQKHHDKNYLLLRNHRQSPVNKSTLLERNRQNLRLARMIVNPVVTYHASQFEKQHQSLSRIKERIMRYETETAQKKMQHYLSNIIHKKYNSRKNSQVSETPNPETSLTNSIHHPPSFRDSQ